MKYAVCNVQFFTQSIKYVVCSDYYAVISMQSLVYSVQCTLLCVQCVVIINDQKMNMRIGLEDQVEFKMSGNMLFRLNQLP